MTTGGRRLWRGIGTFLNYLLLAVIGVTTIIPFVWMACTSLHERNAQLPTMSNLFRPDGWHFENYGYVLTFPDTEVYGD